MSCEELLDARGQCGGDVDPPVASVGHEVRATDDDVTDVGRIRREHGRLDDPLSRRAGAADPVDRNRRQIGSVADCDRASVGPAEARVAPARCCPAKCRLAASRRSPVSRSATAWVSTYRSRRVDSGRAE